MDGALKLKRFKKQYFYNARHQFFTLLRASGARTAQSSKKMMTNFSENGYIHEIGFSENSNFINSTTQHIFSWKKTTVFHEFFNQLE